MSSKANNELRFWFELAEKLGMSVAEAQANVSSNEFSHWMALWKIRADERKKADKEADRQSRLKSHASQGRIRKGF